MQSSDYRINEYSPSYSVPSSKADLLDRIKREHPRMSDYWQAVRGIYKSEFARVYNGRCAYCGLRVEVVSMQGFEIDHIVNRASFGGDDAGLGEEANSLKNLAFSCTVCNRRKGGFYIDEDSWGKLSLDSGLGQTFVRDELYNISVSGRAADHEAVQAFYAKMEFSSELRRVDHLLSSLLDLEDFLNNQHPLGREQTQDVLTYLRAASNALMTKRNIMSDQLMN